MDQVLDLVRTFFGDARVKTLLGLILLDLVLAISAALKLGKFDWRVLPAFYKTMILPYILGYLAAYVATFLVVEEWAGGIAVQLIVTALWAAPIGNLIVSIGGHLKDLGLDVAGFVGKLVNRAGQ